MTEWSPTCMSQIKNSLDTWFDCGSNSPTLNSMGIKAHQTRCYIWRSWSCESSIGQTSKAAAVGDPARGTISSNTGFKFYTHSYPAVQIVHLKNSLRNAALGKAFVLQGGMFINMRQREYGPLVLTIHQATVRSFSITAIKTQLRQRLSYSCRWAWFWSGVGLDVLRQSLLDESVTNS